MPEDQATEVTTRYAKGDLPDLASAWAFVMAKVDLVGGDPEVHITPVWTHGNGHDGERTFSAAVSGMVEEVE